jgi:glucose-1-phosphate adenylyltransferase
MKILAMVLAGGNGTRLHPLTAEHAKPALPFAHGYRIVDFVLSNLVNSDISAIYVLAQYKPQSLIAHIRTAWAPWSGGARPAIKVVLPDASSNGGLFKGTADAVYQNLHLIEHERPVSIAAVPVPIEKASDFGIMATGCAGELRDFKEKPERAAPTHANPGRAYASMGNYLFNPRVMVELLEQANRRGDTDFGHHILPRVPHSHRAFAYDFAGNRIPGVHPKEERGYWRDIGTVDAYFAAQRDVLGPLPRFNHANPKWPIHGDACLPPRRVVPFVSMVSASRPHVALGASAIAAIPESDHLRGKSAR